MAVGWASDGAVNDQIEDSINDEINRVRHRAPRGESALYCEECGEEIPLKRRKAVPGVRLCIKCQQEYDKTQGPAQLFNRRGTKESQLK